MKFVPEPERSERTSALDVTLALPHDQALKALVQGLSGKRITFHQQVGPSAWLKTKSRFWVPNGGDLLDYAWLERRTKLKVAHFGELSSKIELTPYQDPAGTLVRIRIDEVSDQYPIQVLLAAELDPVLVELADQGLLVGVSPWFKPDLGTEVRRAREEKRQQKRNR